jgi:Tfp pilus assembly protein PilO
MIWREKSALLIVLGIVLLANTVFFFTYRVQYQSRLDSLDARLEDAKNELDRAHNARIRADRTFQSYQQVEKDVQRVFDEHWSTQPKRLTMLIGEVKHLASASNLAPPSYTFDLSEVKSDASSKRRSASLGADEVGIAFAVSGTYEQVRRLINLLELSRQFVIIDKVALSSANGDSLALTIHLKTLFRAEASTAASNRL